MLIFDIIAGNLGIRRGQVEQTVELYNQKATIPFISRYRKEVTWGLDEVAIGSIIEQYERLKELEKRKETIVNTIYEQGKLTDDLKNKIEAIWDTAQLEDLYLPYKPKRQTKAEVARLKGLEGLAKMIMSQQRDDLEGNAARFLSKEVETVSDAIDGACDIIAEWVNENEYARKTIRRIFEREAELKSKVVKGKELEASKYQDYFDFSKRLSRCSSYQVLAIRRGEDEKLLKASIDVDERISLDLLNDIFVKNKKHESSPYIIKSIKDAYKRLLKPSIETEFTELSKNKADVDAIKIFAGNVRQLLLAPPLGKKRTLAIDPGYRTGCKVVCLDAEGNLLHNETIYPHPPQNDKLKAGNKIVKLVSTYNIDAIAIGNGTAGRETEQFVTNLRYEKDVQVFSVSENGASVYSASKVARDEFPEYDVTVRGAVSIGRRLLDPLSELVKIDPKAIGVGQYQHDVNQTELKNTLDRTVESCVNLVGVNVNVASKHLLTYVSGLGPTLAQNIVDYRTEHGPFQNRRELKSVTRLGEKAFEQCAGFLRIPDAENPLDNSAVHPESYPIVERMASDLHCTISELMRDKALREKIDLSVYLSEKTGLPTLKDIMDELDKPGRDPRNKIQQFEFDPTIKTISDLREGMVLPGIVTNITDFGCFVDIGIKENGMVHKSQIADQFVSDTSQYVSIHQYVTVKVISIDFERKRVGLSMKN